MTRNSYSGTGGIVTLAPMIAVPPKRTNEIDWITPLKAYILNTYGEDPEQYSEECSTLNRLRQDMRGASMDSLSGRDLLYRYYGQLELLDLRFPIDEFHIKISFTWFDAFTQKPTSQYSLAFEKASIIFNIASLLSNHAANQNRHDDLGLKVSYHSFQAAAGMFSYINENFLHAPSLDLNRETIKALIALMLAQGQEIFLEKQIAGDKKVSLLAKLASQAAFQYSQALEGMKETACQSAFDRNWLLCSQTKTSYMSALAHYYQAMTDNEANGIGTSIRRLELAEKLTLDAYKSASSISISFTSSSTFCKEVGSALGEICQRHLSLVRSKLKELTRDNDFIYHQSVPNEKALAVIPKLVAAKAIPGTELYHDQDIQRIIGPDIFQRIVPMSITESASLYDEEKAKLVRSESEKVDVADDELAAGLDYLRLPESLDILKQGMDVKVHDEPEFRGWCEDLAGLKAIGPIFERIKRLREELDQRADSVSKNLDQEELLCEKMRLKYGTEWTQQPSGGLTTALRKSLAECQQTLREAGANDSQIWVIYQDFEGEIEEMRIAGEMGDASKVFERALVKLGAVKVGKRSGTLTLTGGQQEESILDAEINVNPSIEEQVIGVEELIRKLNLIKKERAAVLKDLKETALKDDISHLLILNAKSIGNQENQLFKAELEKYRAYENRITQANHKQLSVLRELTRLYNALLQDERVEMGRNKYESYMRQRNTLLVRYQRAYEAVTRTILPGVKRAEAFYIDSARTLSNLERNVDVFVNNRRTEGRSILQDIESRQGSVLRQGNGHVPGLATSLSTTRPGIVLSSSVTGVGSMADTGTSIERRGEDETLGSLLKRMNISTNNSTNGMDLGIGNIGNNLTPSGNGTSHIGPSNLSNGPSTILNPILASDLDSAFISNSLSSAGLRDILSAPPPPPPPRRD